MKHTLIKCGVQQKHNRNWVNGYSAVDGGAGGSQFESGYLFFSLEKDIAAR